MSIFFNPGRRSIGGDLRESLFLTKGRMNPLFFIPMFFVVLVFLFSISFKVFFIIGGFKCIT